MMLADIDYLKKTPLIDNELQLILSEKGMTSAPDSNISVYKFRMININSSQEMGGINLRAGYTENIEQYRGNIGFTVFEPYRGHRFAGRSCLLLKPFLNILDNYAGLRKIQYRSEYPAPVG